MFPQPSCPHPLHACCKLGFELLHLRRQEPGTSKSEWNYSLDCTQRSFNSNNKREIFSIIPSITLALCFKDLEQFQDLSCFPSPDPLPLTREKQTWGGRGPHFCRVDFLVANLLGLWSEKKMFLVPGTLINLLLLNPNNLTHWSRERPICFLGGSVSFYAREDSVIRDEGRGGRWDEDVRCNQIFSFRRRGWGSQNLPGEALLQITADSQLWDDSRLWQTFNHFGKSLSSA